MHTFLRKCCKYEPDVPDVLYHYCSVDTMLKIIQNSCIWLSDANKMNDKEELRYFACQMNELVSKLLDKHQREFDSNLINETRKILNKHISSIFSGSAYIVRNSRHYICCFSENGDLLSQWRAYGNDGKGVAIGFNARLLAKFSDLFYYDFIKVIYEIEKNLQIEKYMEENLVTVLSSAAKENNNIIEPEEFAAIEVPVLNERFAFKHPGFMEENEWRLYRIQNANFDEDEDFLLRGAFSKQKVDRFLCSDLKFRCTDRDLLSYFEMGFKECKEDIIKRIVIGPKCDINAMDLKILLRKYKYINDVDSTSIEIKKSDIPYI